MENNTVLALARMLDGEGAYTDIVTIDGESQPKTPKQRGWQRHLENLSLDILRFLINISPNTIKRDIIDFERNCWKNIGFPLGKYPELDAKLQSIIARKYKGDFRVAQ